MYKILASEKTWMESEAVDSVKRLCNLKGAVNVVGYPDLHPGKTPVGISFISKKIIYPNLIGNDIGCSISLFETSTLKRKFKIDKVMKTLNSIETLSEYNDFNKGSIGGGNHFCEFTIIDKVLDENEYNILNLDKNKIYLLVHSGSRGFGEFILNRYIKEYALEDGFVEGSSEFTSYMNDHNKAITFAKESRQVIATNMCNTCNVALDKIIIDNIHNGIEVKDEYYIHRKGASSSNDGYAIIAGSRGTPSYIVKPINSSLESGFSISHGAGRKWARKSCKEKLQGKFLRKDIKSNKFDYNLVCKNKNLIYEEAPEAYKNIDSIISDLVNFNLIKVVAKLKPLVTYKE